MHGSVLKPEVREKLCSGEVDYFKGYSDLLAWYMRATDVDILSVRPSRQRHWQQHDGDIPSGPAIPAGGLAMVLSWCWCRQARRRGGDWLAADSRGECGQARTSLPTSLPPPPLLLLRALLHYARGCMQDLQPPKENYVEVFALRDCGSLMTMTGPRDVKKDEVHNVRKYDAEALIRLGWLKHVTESS